MIFTNKKALKAINKQGLAREELTFNKYGDSMTKLDEKVKLLLIKIQLLMVAREKRKEAFLPHFDLSLRLWWNCKLLSVVERSCRA